MLFFDNNSTAAYNNHTTSLCLLYKVERGSSSHLELLEKASVAGKTQCFVHSSPHKAKSPMCLCSGHQLPGLDLGHYPSRSCAVGSFYSFERRNGGRH